MNSFPAAFADLQKYVDWVLPTEAARMQRRRDSSFEQLKDLYDTVLPRLPDILEHLNMFPLETLPAEEQRLMLLTFAFAEVTPFVEQYRRTVLPELFDERRFVVLHDAKSTAAAG